MIHFPAGAEKGLRSRAFFPAAVDIAAGFVLKYGETLFYLRRKAGECSMKYLITYAPGFTPEMYRAFEDLGLELVQLPGHGDPSFEAKACDVDFSDIDMIQCYQFFTYHDVTRFTNLKYVHTTSSGLDHMPLDYLYSRGVTVDNAPGAYSVPMAEYALSGVLQLYRSSATLAQRQKDHVWKRVWQARELGGKHVTILGTGCVGTECAKRFTALGCRCTGLCRHPDPTAEHYETQIHIDRLDEILPETDILIFALPLTAETHHLMDARRFGLLKQDAVLVNIARGAVVDADAMVAALNSGRLSGAVADVFEQEPLPADSPLWDVENLIVTPHNSFVGEGNPRRLFDLIYKDVVKWLKEKGELK